MAEKEMTRQRFADNAVRICVDRCTHQDVAGRMYNRLSEREVPFESMADLLLSTDALLNDVGRPQSFQQLRTFQTERLQTEHRCSGEPGETGQEANDWDACMRQQSGRQTTIDIVIQSRKHATWQGFAIDPGGGFLGEYESELQLMQLILKQSHGI